MDFLFKFTDSLIIICARKKHQGPAGVVGEQLLGSLLFSNGNKGEKKEGTLGVQMPPSCLNWAQCSLLIQVTAGADSALHLEGRPPGWGLGSNGDWGATVGGKLVCSPTSLKSQNRACSPFPSWLTSNPKLHTCSVDLSFFFPNFQK